MNREEALAIAEARIIEEYDPMKKNDPIEKAATVFRRDLHLILAQAMAKDLPQPKVMAFIIADLLSSLSSFTAVSVVEGLASSEDTIIEMLKDSIAKQLKEYKRLRAAHE